MDAAPATHPTRPPVWWMCELLSASSLLQVLYQHPDESLAPDTLSALYSSPDVLAAPPVAEHGAFRFADARGSYQVRFCRYRFWATGELKYRGAVVGDRALYLIVKIIRFYC